MTLSRRQLLSATVLAAALPLGRLSRAAPLPRDADIVVIGAGAAGIAAARRIAAANRKVVIVEASGQIGGRCQTDMTTFDVPFDRGARWLHNPDGNPMVRLARASGFDTIAAPLGQRIRVGRRNARAGETEDFLASLVRAKRAIDEAARKSDVSAASALPKDLGDWAATVDFVLGAGATGKDLKDISAADLANAQDRSAAIGIRQGVGALMVKLAEGIPASLGTPVTRVTWSGRELGVETASGRIATRAVIVTASPNALTSGSIKFAPDLPKRQLDAASKLSLGSYDRIAVQLPANVLGLTRNEAMIEQSTGTRTALLQAYINGATLCTIDVAGSFGRDLTAQGDAAMQAFAREWLTKLFGSDAAAAIKRTAVTRWNAQPYVFGAMSAAVPGGQTARKVMLEPLGNLLFAGDAVHETMWGTVDGAWDSGERAADVALRRIGAIKDSAPPAPARRRRPRSAAMPAATRFP